MRNIYEDFINFILRKILMKVVISKNVFNYVIEMLGKNTIHKCVVC